MKRQDTFAGQPVAAQGVISKYWDSAQAVVRFDKGQEIVLPIETLQPITANAEPDVAKLRKAAEDLLQWYEGPYGVYSVFKERLNALRKALAATPEPPVFEGVRVGARPEPAHTCGECRWWCECGATVYGCTYPYYGDKHFQANWRACGFFQPYPKGGA